MIRIVAAAKSNPKKALRDSINQRPLIIGMAGGVASGKSAVARMFAAFGAAVVEADRIAGRVLESRPVREKLKKLWGDDVLTAAGLANRARIADMVFHDEKKRQTLNRLIHPPVIREMRKQMNHLLRDGRTPLIVLDAPLLMEGQLGAWCDSIAYVEATARRRAERAAKARHWRRGEIERREAAQMKLSEKKRRADEIINNNGSLEATREQVARLFLKWTESRTVKPRRPRR